MEAIKANIINEENDPKEKLLKWRKELIFKLENKENQTMNIFLVGKDIFDKNVQKFFITLLMVISLKKNL